MKHDIEYKGKKYHSKDGFEVISDNEYQAIKKEWYLLPDFDKVLLEMSALRQGLVSISCITDYYFRKLMDNTVKYYDKWSINDVFDNKELLSVFVDRTKRNPKVFSSKSIVENIDTAFRLGGKGIASKVSQFPLKVVDQILEKFNVNGNWYDFSCGWGGRLAGALKNRVNYFGTDPNYLLVDKLKEFSADYKKSQNSKTKVDIRCTGSEIFHSDWEGKMGLAFSSPPYFLLEDYKIGNQSYRDGTTYKDWLNKYLYPTMKNIKKYLIDDGFFIVNIKDFDKYALEADTIRCAEFAGFYLWGIEELKQGERCGGDVKSDECRMVDVNEKIYVFAKKGFNPKTVKVEQQSIFDLM